MTATGGGAAANAGIEFQQRLGALIMALMLVDRQGLGIIGPGWDYQTVRELRFETDEAIDDLFLKTDSLSILVQAKRSLDLSGSPNSEYSAVIRQVVAQYHRHPGAGQHYLVAVSPRASGRVRNELRRLTESARLSERGMEVNPQTKVEERVHSITNGLLDHHFAALAARRIAEDERVELWRRIHVAVLDLSAGGPLEALAITAMAGRGLPDPAAIWGRLVALGLECATDRLSVDRIGLRRRLAAWLPGRTGASSVWDSPDPGEAVTRSKLIDELLAALRSVDGETLTVLTGVHGAGGFGKTTLVKQLCAMPAVRQTYAALLWTTLGEDLQGGALASRLNDLSARLTGERPSLADPQQAGFQLNRAIEAVAGRVLLVIDDVWHHAQLAPFLAGAANCTRLVTTRSRLVVDKATCVLVGQMRRDEADAVLTAAVPGLPAATVAELHRLTGRWPVLLGITNHALRHLARYGCSPADAGKALIQRLRAHGPTALDIADPSERNLAVAATVDVGLELLTPATRQRFQELAVFAEDSWIPLDLLEAYWRATGGLGRTTVEHVCLELADLSMVSDLSLDTRTVRLHDVLRAYLVQKLGAEKLAILHSVLVETARRFLPVNPDNAAQSWWMLPSMHGYLADHLVGHLIAAGRADEAAAVACDLRWVEARISSRGAAAIEADLSLVDSAAAQTLAQTLRQNSHLCEGTEPASALGAVLVSRLSGMPELRPAVAAHRARLGTPYLVNRWPLPDLPHPAARGALGGHSAGITDIAIGPDGTWLVTVEGFGTVRVWDVRTGTVAETITTSNDFSVNRVQIAPDGTWLAIVENADREGRVRIWNRTTGAVGHTFSSAVVTRSEESVSMAVCPAVTG